MHVLKVAFLKFGLKSLVPHKKLLNSFRAPGSFLPPWYPVLKMTAPLDISKVFDKVWHKGFIHKLKQSRIGGPLFKVWTDFLKLRKQRVVLNGQHSPWSDVLAGVTHRSTLGLLLFLIHINKLTDGLQWNPQLFVDDNSSFTTVHNINKATNDLNNDLTKTTKWAFQWKMSFDPDISKQTHEIIFPQKVHSIPSFFNFQ